MVSQKPGRASGRSRPKEASQPTAGQTLLARAKEARRAVVEDRILLILLAAGLLSRLLYLGAPDLWLDEYATAGAAGEVAGQSPLFFPHFLAYQIHRLSLALSHTVWGLRLPSALFGVFSILCAYLLARAWLGRSTARIAAALALISPYLFYFGHEARFYTMLFAWETLSLYFASLFILRNSFWAGAAALATAWAAYMTHPAVAGIIAGEVLAMAALGVWNWKHYWRRLGALRPRGRWLYWGTLAALALGLLAAFALAVRMTLYFIPVIVSWQSLPLPGNMSFTPGFFLEHLRQYIVSPAASRYVSQVLFLGYLFGAIGFLAIWRRKPLLNSIFLLQYVLYFAILFLARSSQEYTWKYATGLLTAQIVWIACGINAVAGLAARLAKPGARPLVRALAASAALAVFALLYIPDCVKICSHSINPVREALERVRASDKTPPHSVFGLYVPYVQIQSMQTLKMGYAHLDEITLHSVRPDQIFSPGGFDGILWQMKRVGYWTKNAWLLGNSMGGDGKPVIAAQVKNRLELVAIYPSTLWDEFKSFLYRLPGADRLLLSPYPASFSARLTPDGAGSLRLTCLSGGVWRMSASRAIRSLSVDGRPANPASVALSAGDHALRFRIEKKPGLGTSAAEEKIRFQNALPEERYSLAFYKEPLVDGPEIVDSQAFVGPVAELPTGERVDIPLVRKTGAPERVFVELTGSAQAEKSFVAVVAGGRVAALVSLEGAESKQFPLSLPPQAGSLGLVNITPTQIQAEGVNIVGSTNTPAFLSDLTIREGAAAVAGRDDNLLTDMRVAASQAALLPFFSASEGGANLTWRIIGLPEVSMTKGSEEGRKAIEIEIKDDSCVLFSPFVPLEGAETVFWKTRARSQRMAAHGFVLRVYYYDENSQLLRVNAASVQESFSGDGWQDVVYYDEARPGEAGFRVELKVYLLSEGRPTESVDVIDIDEFVSRP